MVPSSATKGVACHCLNCSYPFCSSRLFGGHGVLLPKAGTHRLSRGGSASLRLKFNCVQEGLHQAACNAVMCLAEPKLAGGLQYGWGICSHRVLRWHREDCFRTSLKTFRCVRRRMLIAAFRIWNSADGSLVQHLEGPSKDTKNMLLHGCFLLLNRCSCTAALMS